MRSSLDLELDRLDAAVDGLAGADLAGSDIDAHQRRVRRAINRLEYQFLRGLTAQTARTGSSPEMAISWMTTELKISRGAAAERLEVARQLGAHPRTARLLSVSALSYEQAAIVARSTAAVAPEDAQRVEARLLECADDAPGRLRDIAGAVVAEVDGEALLRKESRRAWERRGLRIGPIVGGSATVSGYLTAEAATHWRLAAEPWMVPASREDRRSKEQRLHDATVQILKGVGVTAGAVGNRRRPQLVITAPLSTLMGEAGPPALLEGLVPIPREELARCVCEADLTFLLRDAAGNIAFQARRTRFFSPAKKRGIFSLYPICVWPGCERPSRECTVHHLEEYGQGGETTSDVGAPTCGVHHDMVHCEGWALVERGDGRFRTLSPTHPDNPQRGLPAAEYIRRRLLAMTARKRPRAVASRR